MSHSSWYYGDEDIDELMFDEDRDRRILVYIKDGNLKLEVSSQNKSRAVQIRDYISELLDEKVYSNGPFELNGNFICEIIVMNGLEVIDGVVTIREDVRMKIQDSMCI